MERLLTDKTGFLLKNIESFASGVPLHIPELTWEGLREFYAKSYHPTNSLFFTYGNFPLQQTLNQISSHVLQHFEKIELDNEIPEEVKWTEPRVCKAYTPLIILGVTTPMSPNEPQRTLHQLGAPRVV